METTLIARWETRGKRYWIELFRNPDGTYRRQEDNASGSYGDYTEIQAITDIEGRVTLARDIDRINYKRVTLP